MNPYTTAYQIIPKMGWDSGLNLAIIWPDITLHESDNEDRTFMGKRKVDMTTLVVKVRDIPGGRHNVGFLPEEGVFVLVPDWIFREVSL